MQFGRRVAYGCTIVILLLIQQSAATGYLDCVRCELYNRLSNKEIQCAQNYKECGDCSPGFIQDSNEDRLCVMPYIVDTSLDVTMDSGSFVYLPCHFNGRVNCTWTKDGKYVNMTHLNYEWDSWEGIDTNDCGIEIYDATESDTGEWVCSNKVDFGLDSIIPEDMVVSLTHQITVHPGPTYNVSAGESVTIECRFNKPANCSWYNGEHEISLFESNHRFTLKETNAGCSLTIHSFILDYDQGNWSCDRLVNIDEEGIIISSRRVQVQGYTKSHTTNPTSAIHTTNPTSASHTTNPTSASHTTKATFVNGAPQPGQAPYSLHSSYPYLMVDIYILNGMVLATIGFLVYHHCIKKKRLNQRKSTSKSQLSLQNHSQ